MNFIFETLLRKPEAEKPSPVFYYKNLVFKHDRKPRYRSIRITVEKNGSLNLLTSVNQRKEHINEFLLKNDRWIHQRLQKNQSLFEKHPVHIGLEGEQFYFLGEKRTLVIGGTEDIAVKGPNILIGDPKSSCYQRLQKIRQYYRQEAERILPEIMQIRSRDMGLKPEKLIFRGNVSRWGSCNVRGTISLNWKLVAAPLKTIDYVVVHELAHLEHRNHGKKFWNLVERFVPDYQDHVDWLRAHNFDLDFLSHFPYLYASPWKS